MGFRSVNEIDHFSFRDCIINCFEKTENGLRLELSALIVEPQNSQNTNYTRSYAGDTVLTLRDGRLEKGIKEGFRYYSADDVLLSETPDTELDEASLAGLLPSLAGAFLYDVQQLPGSLSEKTASAGTDAGANGPAQFTCVLGIEMPDDPDWPEGVTDSYQIRVSFTEAVFTWEHYLNRVGS